jgi:hypothetical protein
MGWHDSGNHKSWVARREATWNAIAGSGYLAPGRIAMNEVRERTLAEAAHARLLGRGKRPTHGSLGDVGRRIFPAPVTGLGRWLRRSFPCRVTARFRPVST